MMTHQSRLLASKFIGGAMENISLVTWSDLYVMDETLFKERGLMVDLTNIHEMAHTFFGDMLVIRHFEHVWLKESWATYTEALWLQDNWNEDEFRYEMLGNAERYMAETGRYTRPIVTRQYEHSWAMFDSHTYPGGGWRIHMLRCLCGDEAFWAGVKSMYLSFFPSKIKFRTNLLIASKNKSRLP
jgi:aminopeptidase N